MRLYRSAQRCCLEHLVGSLRHWATLRCLQTHPTLSLQTAAAAMHLVCMSGSWRKRLFSELWRSTRTRTRTALSKSRSGTGGLPAGAQG